MLVKLKKQELLKNLKIIIMSDTGAKIENYNNKFLSTFFILKERDAKFFIDNNKISNQEIFLKIFQ